MLACLVWVHFVGARHVSDHILTERLVDRFKRYPRVTFDLRHLYSCWDQHASLGRVRSEIFILLLGLVLFQLLLVLLLLLSHVTQVVLIYWGILDVFLLNPFWLCLFLDLLLLSFTLLASALIGFPHVFRVVTLGRFAADTAVLCLAAEAAGTFVTAAGSLPLLLLHRVKLEPFVFAKSFHHFWFILSFLLQVMLNLLIELTWSVC